MTADTDFTHSANLALHFSEKDKRDKKKENAPDPSENPTEEHETRFGVLPPWGGASGTGASTPIEHDPQVVGDD